MILRELVTMIGFRVETAPLKVYDTAIRQVQNTANGLMSSLGNAYRELFSLSKKIGIGTQLSFYGIAAAGLTATASVEKAQVMFEVLLKSQEKAKLLMDELFQFEAKTPFDLPSIIKFSNQLLIAKTSAENVTNELTMLGEVAAGDAERLNQIIYIVGKMRGIRILDTEMINQFTTAMVPMRSTLEKMLGVSGEALQKQIEQRKITHETAWKALQIISAERQGLMRQQSLTLGGLWSSLMSSIFRLRNAIGESFKYAFNVDKIIGKLIKNIDAITKFINNLSKPMKKLGAWIWLIFGRIKAIIMPILFISKLLFLIQIATIALKIALGGLHWIIVGLGLIGIKITLSMFIPILLKIAAILGMMALKFLIIGAVLAGIFIIVEDIIGYFTGKNSVIIPALMKLSDLIEEKLRSLFGMTKEEWDLTMMYFVENWENTFGKIYDFTIEIFKKIQEAIKKYGILNLLFSTNPITAPVTLLSKGGRQLQKDMWGGIGGVANKAWGLSQGTASPMYQNIVNISGQNFTVPEGTPQHQREAIGKAAKEGTEAAINAAYRQDFVRQMRSATKDH